MFKKSKKERIEEEKDLTVNDGLSGKVDEVRKNIFYATQAAKWFEKHVAEEQRLKARNYKRISIFFGVLCFMSIAALMGITPLKTVIPVVLRVDNNSGYVDIVKPTSESSESPEEKEDKRNIMIYVMNRESYNWASQSSNYNVVKLLSYEDVFQDYKNFQLSSKGYVAVMGRNEQFKTEVNSIVLLPSSNDPAFSKNSDIKTYQVRFKKTLLDANGRPVIDTRPTAVLATISFDYKNPAMTEGDEWINPRGFGVRAYSKTQEVYGG